MVLLGLPLLRRLAHPIPGGVCFLSCSGLISQNFMFWAADEPMVKVMSTMHRPARSVREYPGTYLAYLDVSHRKGGRFVVLESQEGLDMDMPFWDNT